MIQDDIIVSIVRRRNYKLDWPEQTFLIKKRLNEMKLGFIGLGNDHLSLVEFKDLNVGDRFIFDQYIDTERFGDEAPIMYKILSDNIGLIEGIGCGLDSIRDPDRLLYRWKDTVNLPDLNPHQLVCRVDVNPVMSGGPGYYYFFRSYRDNRL